MRFDGLANDCGQQQKARFAHEVKVRVGLGVEQICSHVATKKREKRTNINNTTYKAIFLSVSDENVS